MSESPEFRLVRPTFAVPRAPTLDPGQRRVRDHDRGVLRVLAGPGTGKTTAIVEAVADRVGRRGVGIEHILLLTFSRPAAGQLRDRVTSRLQRTIAEPVARTFHSYAFGVLRQAAVLAGAPVPRLLSGSEQDVTVRELIAGRLLDGTATWPPELTAAVPTQAFAAELRDLLMRAIERDITPATLARLGTRHRRPDWVAAADLLREYLQVTALKAPGAFDAAELIQRASDELRRNRALLAAEHQRRRRIFVDEYQDTDPAQVQLLSLLAAGADELVVLGDPDQAIYSFRGASRNALADFEEQFAASAGSLVTETVALNTSRRSGATLLAATRRIANRLTGPAQHRALAPAAGSADGVVEVAVFAAASQEAAHVASVLRRAHVEQGVPWSDMAVLVRSSGPAADSLRRGLAAAGVPIGQSVRGALTDEPVVAQLLMLLQAVAEPATLTEDAAEALLCGPIGRADPLQLLRMRRFARAAAGAGPGLAELVTEPGASALIPAAARPPAARLQAALTAGRAAAESAGATGEDVLWAVWQASRLAGRLDRRSLAGGADGARADRALDAVAALFAEAAKVSDRTPGGGLSRLNEWVARLTISDDPQTGGDTGDAVAVLSAHAAKGLEWDVVCVAGVQDGSWPSVRQRGSLLGADLLVDIVDGRATETSGLLAERLVEERRLFYVAATRARRQLLVTALANDDTQPSRFLDELAPLAPTVDRRPVSPGGRRFELPGLVAELRAALADADLSAADHDAAAAELARLAAAGVPGAHPDEWWGLAGPSTDGSIRDPARGPVPIRPSKFEAYADCELRALLTEVGATDASDETAAALGTLVHWVAEQAPPGAGIDELTELLAQRWDSLDFAAPWHGVRERDRAQRMLAALAGWLADSRTEFELLAREARFSVAVGDAVLTGTIDRLERDQRGRLVVVDLKTGKSKPTKAEMATHPQLAAYQLAVAEGGFTDGVPADPGGGRLVQLGTASTGSQVQPPMADFADPDWVRTELGRIAGVLRGSTVSARPGPSCTRCPVRSSCPAQDDGRAVTR